MKAATKIVFALLAVAVVVSAAFGYLYVSQPSPSVALSGEGATFPVPLLNAMFITYNSTKTNIQINYNGVGSSGGIRALGGKACDFACSDAPLSASDSTTAPNVLHIPETIGAVAIAYNLPGVSSGLHLTGEVIADIFLGKIFTWNDPAIQVLNPTVTLPAENITVVHRSEGSGTTFIFTSFLSEDNANWKNSLGSAKTVQWPVGLGATGNPGVASVVQANPYAIGYVELAYVIENDMTVAAVQNPSDNFVVPSLESTQIAAQSGASKGLPTGSGDWTGVSLLNAPDPNAYPIVSFSYTLIYQELNVIPSMTHDRAEALVQFLWWMVHDGQEVAPDLEYAALPLNVVQVNEATIQSITFNGQSLPTT
ncbi:MAG: phosphate ABC transporter substrate-binding protein PstS [Candidatus Bathyarchaeia archaeon]|jgi:phosphate ABC transporter phosphate-binding protein